VKDKEVESYTGPTKLPPEVLEKLKKENRCFECQEQGHWANKCPKSTNRGTKDDVLLQIISSGKSEVTISTLNDCSQNESEHQAKGDHIDNRPPNPCNRGNAAPRLYTVVRSLTLLAKRMSRDSTRIFWNR
jgi:hypothetical protein